MCFRVTGIASLEMADISLCFKVTGILAYGGEGGQGHCLLHYSVWSTVSVTLLTYSVCVQVPRLAGVGGTILCSVLMYKLVSSVDVCCVHGLESTNSMTFAHWKQQAP